MNKSIAMIVTVVGAILAVVCAVLMCTLSNAGSVWGAAMLVCFVVMVIGLLNSSIAKK